MAEISEKQARAICRAFDIDPGDLVIVRAADYPGLGKPWQSYLKGYVATEVPAWRIVQRAAAEAEEQKP